MQKRLEETPNNGKNDKIFESGRKGHFAKAIVRQNDLLWC